MINHVRSRNSIYTHAATRRAWNSLPVAIWTASSLTTFRRQLNTFLHTQSFSDHKSNYYRNINTPTRLSFELENVAIANALQLEVARRRAVPIRFNFVARVSLNSLSLSVAVLERFNAHTLRYTVILNFDP